jgi:hypothetical protein
MPPEPTPAESKQYADILLNTGRPSLSATSDMPVLDLAAPSQGTTEAVPAEQVDTEAKPDQPDGTSGDSETKPEGAADAQPDKEGGEEKDKTSPQQRAAFARERNKRQAAEQRATALETQVAQLAQAVAKLSGETDRAKEDPRPSRETFDDPNAYDKALEDWAGRRASEVAKAEAKADQLKQQQDAQNEALRNAFTERKQAFEKDHPDFDDVVFSEDVPISLAMSQAILEAEDGPAIAYHLGENPEVAERISKLSPAQAVIEMGRISQKLAAPPPKPKPAPIVPLAARNSAGEKSPDDMSMDEYAAHRKARMKAN